MAAAGHLKTWSATHPSAVAARRRHERSQSRRPSCALLGRDARDDSGIDMLAAIARLGREAATVSISPTQIRTPPTSGSRVPRPSSQPQPCSVVSPTKTPQLPASRPQLVASRPPSLFSPRFIRNSFPAIFTLAAQGAYRPPESSPLPRRSSIAGQTLAIINPERASTLAIRLNLSPCRAHASAPHRSRQRLRPCSIAFRPSLAASPRDRLAGELGASPGSPIPFRGSG
jgi:hypothetical protein